MSHTQFARYIDEEGRISFKIGDHLLDPTKRKEQIAVAHLLKQYDHRDNHVMAGNQWVEWLGLRPSHGDRYTRLRAAWRMFTPMDDLATVAKHIGPILDSVFGEQPAPVERHPVQLIVRVSQDKCEPKPIALLIQDTRTQPSFETRELDPNIHDDVVKAIYCLKSKRICPPMFEVEADALKLLTDWYGQADAQVQDSVFMTMWQSVLPAERFDDKPQASDVPGAILSVRSRIGTLLDEHTELAGTLFGANFEMTDEQGALVINQDSIIANDLPKLQQRLADLFDELTKSQADQQLVLKARGATVQDCHTLGLLSDDDMANHLADCLTVVLGKPVGAKAAKAVILDAVQSDGDTSAYVTRLAYSAVQKENDDLRLQCGGMQSTLDEAALQITCLKDLLAQINNAGSRWVFMDGLALQVQVALTPADEEQPE